MNLKDAQEAVGLAGRELGGGPGAAVDRIVPGLAEEELTRRFEAWKSTKPERIKAQFRWDAPREKAAKMASDAYAYGVAVGLVAAEDEDALAVLKDISKEWSRGS